MSDREDCGGDCGSCARCSQRTEMEAEAAWRDQQVESEMMADMNARVAAVPRGVQGAYQVELWAKAARYAIASVKLYEAKVRYLNMVRPDYSRRVESLLVRKWYEVMELVRSFYKEATVG